MLPRPDGFLAHLYDIGKPIEDRDRQVGRYIAELHDYLWRFVWAAIPGASGNLGDYLPSACLVAEGQAAAREAVEERSHE